MAGPWERYQAAAETGPWTKYQQAPAAPSEPKAEAWNPGLGIARDLVEGIPILGPLYTGAVDQVTSNIAGAITGEDPAAIRDRVNSKQDAYQEQNPILSTGAQIVGGTVATAPLAATAAGARAFGLTGPLWQRALLGAGSGSVVSGADSLVRDGDPMNALVSGGIGAVLGGGASALGPSIARGVDNLTRLAGFGGPRVAGDELSGPARDTLMRALIADGTLGNGGMTNIANAGPNAMLADAGPNAASLLDTTIQRSGTGSRTALDAVEARAAQANQDVTSALDAALGQPQGVATVESGLRTGTAGARRTAYDAAYASPIDYASDAGREVEQMITRVPQGVIQLANRMMALEGQQSAQIMAQIAEDGTVTYLRMPDVRQLDYITRALNQAARSGEGQGALGGQTDIGRLYGNLAREIRDTVRGAVPAYDTALSTAATPIQAREALQFGQGLLSPSVARDEAQMAIDAMTEPQLQAARQGVRSYIDEILANVRSVASDPNLDAREAKKALQDLSSRAVQDKLRMVIGDDATTNELLWNLAMARRALELRANVSGNSRTFARMAMDEAVANQFDNGIANTMLKGEPVNAIRSGIQAVTGRTPQGVQNMKDEVYAELARTLTMPSDRALDMLAGLSTINARQPRPASYLPGAVAPSASALEQLMGL